MARAAGKSAEATKGYKAAKPIAAAKAPEAAAAVKAAKSLKAGKTVQAGKAVNANTVSAAGGRENGARAVRAAARREAILAAALDEFSARGFAAARLDDVAKRAGVAKGTIYLHFADKETLFQELIRSVVSPVIVTLEAAALANVPIRAIAERIVEVVIREIYETRRKDVLRLIITEGPRFPAIAEFYYREVLSRVLGTVRALLAKAAERGEVSASVARFPQLLGAPIMLGIIWKSLFDRFEPLDARAFLTAHLDVIFGKGRAA